MKLPFSLSFNKRYLVTGTLIYILSAYLAFLLDVSKSIMPYILIFTAAVAIVLFAVLLFMRRYRHIKQVCSAIMLCIIVFSLGFCRCSYAVQKYNRQAECIASAAEIVGMVADVPSLSNSGKSISLTVDVNRCSDGVTDIIFDDECLVSIYIPVNAMNDTPGIGDIICFGNLSSLDTPPDFEGDFDFSGYLRQNRITAPMYAHSAQYDNSLYLSKPLLYKYKEFGYTIRNGILDSTNLISYSADNASLLQGLLIGNTDAFTDELHDTYADSGFIHLTSVSGMHTSYIFIVISFLLSLIRIPRKWAYVITIPILMLFMSVASFTPSVSRAVLTMIIMMLAFILGRSNDSITALAAAALIMSIINPYCLQSYSFLMSFGATLGIIIYYPLLRRCLSFAVMKAPDSPYTKQSQRRNYSVPKKLLYGANVAAINSICMSLGATIGISCFSMHFFGKIHLGSIIGNILIIPFTGAAFIGGYINSLIYIISPVASEFVASLIISPSLSCINTVARLFSTEFFSINTPSPPVSFFFVYLFICIALYYILTPEEKE